MSSAQALEDHIADVSQDSIVFRGAKRGLVTQVAENVADATLEEAMQGASDLNVEVRDDKYKALNSGLFDTRFFCVIDGVSFRYTELSLVSQYLLRVSFEHALIAEMREHTGNVTAIRGNVTRAEFILSMLRELKLPFRFICPELHHKQKTPAPEQVKESHEVQTGGQTVASSLGEVGRGPQLDHSKLTVKHAPMTAAQAKIINDAYAGAQSVSASTLAIEAMIVSLIQESDVSDLNSGPGERGPFSMIDSTVAGIRSKSGGGSIDPHNTKEVAEHYITAGFTGAGGANALARQNPTAAPHTIASSVEGPKVEYPASWDGEAKAITAALGGGGSIAGAGAGGETVPLGTTTVQSIKTATFEFSRGKPGEPEDTYTCALRLAEEVGWRFFIVGERDIYFVNDEDLLKAAPRYVITPKTLGLTEDLTFDWEAGNRRIIEGGRKVLKPSEGTLNVRADRYAAPPGTVIALEGWGPADGKWLVDSPTRSLYDAQTTIHIRTPQKPLEEPKATASTSPEELTGTSGGTAEGSAGETGNAGTSASRAVEKKLASEHPELQPGVRKVVAIILTQFPELTITSTTGGTHATHSLHYEGRAADLAGANMDAIGTWIAKNLTSMLTEGIHNPTLAVKNGKAVNGPVFYAEVWAGHVDHIHVGV